MNAKDPFIRFWTWSCGDECECYEPRIELCIPKPPDYRWLDLTDIWKGEWRTAAYEEMDAVKAELITAVKEYGFESCIENIREGNIHLFEKRALTIEELKKHSEVINGVQATQSKSRRGH